MTSPSELESEVDSLQHEIDDKLEQMRTGVHGIGIAKHIEELQRERDAKLARLESSTENDIREVL